MKPQDFDRLSAYIDDQLSAPEKAALEQRLAREPELRAGLRELRLTVQAVRALPQVKPPRSFTLTPAQAGLPARARRARPGGLFGTLRLAASLSALALAVVVGGDLAATGGLLGTAASPAQDTIFTTERTAELTTAQGAAAAATAEESEMSVMSGAAEATDDLALPEAELAPAGGADQAATATPEMSAALAPQGTPVPTTAGDTAPDTDSAATADAFNAASAETATQGTKVLPPADATVPADETLTALYAADGQPAQEPAPAPGLSPLRVLQAALAMLTVLLGLGAWLASRNP